MLRITPFLLAGLTACIVPTATAQSLPGDPFAEQTFDPTVEIVIATGNGLMAAYNGYMFYAGRRRQFAAGLGVVLGAVGIAIGLRDQANYPTADLALGALGVVAGGANMLLHHAFLGRGPLRIGAAALSVPASGQRAAISFRLRLEPSVLNHHREQSY